MEARITFRSQIYITGDSIDEIKRKWNNIHLFDKDAVLYNDLGFIDVESVERTENESYDDFTDEFLGT